MKTKEFKYKVMDRVEEELNCYIWEPDEKPVAVLQITHGMTEHMGRYMELAEALTSKGIVVAGFDLPGHGKNLELNEVEGCASFGENGWKKALKQIDLFYQYLQEHYGELPHVMLGFSLGSFLQLQYDCTYRRNHAGTILVGCGSQPKFVLNIMQKIIAGHIKKVGFNGTNDKVHNLAFKNYDNKFKGDSEEFRWLCSDKDELRKYKEDTRCAKTISAGLFYDLVGSMAPDISTIVKTTPTLVISGTEDPVGSGHGVENLVKKLNQYKNDVKLVKLPGRHDLFHEKVNGTSEKLTEMISDFVIRNSQNM